VSLSVCVRVCVRVSVSLFFWGVGAADGSSGGAWSGVSERGPVRRTRHSQFEYDERDAGKEAMAPHLFLWHKFSKVGALLNLINTVTNESTYEKPWRLTFSFRQICFPSKISIFSKISHW
jgi:hypothetical protein